MRSEFFRVVPGTVVATLLCQLCCDALGEHDSRDVGRDRRNIGNDGCVDDVQAFDSAHLAPRVNDSGRVGISAHWNRRGRMEIGRNIGYNVRAKRLTVIHGAARCHLMVDQVGKWRGPTDPAGQPHGFRQPAQVVGVMEEIVVGSQLVRRSKPVDFGSVSAEARTIAPPVGLALGSIRCVAEM